MHSSGPDFIVILGAWGSGTTSVARALAQAEIDFCAPYFETNDPRTKNSFESLAFREVIQKHLNEKDKNLFSSKKEGLNHSTGIMTFPIDAGALTILLEKSLFSFRESVSKKSNKSRIGLKMPLASLCVPELTKALEPYFVVVHRPFEDIEKSRLRRGWSALYGAQGALQVYSKMFSDLIANRQDFLSVSYPKLTENPEGELQLMLDFLKISRSNINIRKCIEQIVTN